MKKDIIAMSQKERQRYHLLKMVIGGKITLKETDNFMGVSSRAIGIDAEEVLLYL